MKKPEPTKPQEFVYSYFCGFGNRHALHSACDCQSQYGVFACVFRTKSLEMFPEIQYMQNLTNIQRIQVLKSLN